MQWRVEWSGVSSSVLSAKTVDSLFLLVSALIEIYRHALIRLYVPPHTSVIDPSGTRAMSGDLTSEMQNVGGLGGAPARCAPNENLKAKLQPFGRG
jgi:hypothetical protein